MLLFVTGVLQAQDKASLVIRMAPDKEFQYWFSGMDYLSDYEQAFARSEVGKTDSTGLYFKEFIIDKPTILNLGRVVKTIMSILPVYLTSGGHDTISIVDNKITFQGTNADYNRTLQMTEAFMDYCNQLLIGRPSKDPLFQTKSLPEFEKSLNEKRIATEKNITQSSGIAAAFVDEQLAHINLGARLAFIYKVLYNVPDSLQTDDWKQASKSILSKTIDTPFFPSFREGYFLLDGFLALDYFIEMGNTEGKTVSFDSFERLPKLVNDKNLEYAWATLINNDIASKTYDPIAPELYDMLKVRFPENTYKSFLEAGIQENLHFNALSVADALNSDYQIIPCDSSFHSLADAVKSLKGKVVYVDLWATWCGSCLAEFSYLPQVEKKVKDLDIAFVYVSMDKPENKTRWEKSFRHYKLKGYHVLATPELAESIRKQFGYYIPHAVIFDKAGNIVEPNAPGLKQFEKLYEKLSEVSK